ncbi:LysR family transcriptional regulator, partial [Klebsiella variicola]|nr:LysR family transcriptional regulator [Klebsiella variicola]
CPVAEGDAMPLSLGVIYPPYQAESVQQWLSLLDGILATG